MEIGDAQLAAAIRLAIAALIGLGVGLEREWSGHASGPLARFAGLRTFFLLGLLGGIAGLLVHAGHDLVAAAIVAGGSGLAIAAYIMVVRQTGAERDGTTEVAAIVVLALGIVAGAVSLLIAAGAGSFVVLALNEKKRLHGAIRQLGEGEFRAGLQFAVLALVILPILPEGPFFGWAAVRPQMLWIVVLLFCAMNFAAYLAKRNAGERRGYLLTGLLGGVISSTAVTFGLARYSRKHSEVATSLASGVIAACTVLVPRVLVISTALNPQVAARLVPLIAPAGLIGLAVLAFAWRYPGRLNTTSDEAAPAPLMAIDEKNPLRLWTAIKLAVVFQMAISTIALIRDMWTVEGLYGTAVLMGLTNADVLTVAMSSPSTELLPVIAARAIAAGILANTLVKLGISAAMGTAKFRLVAGSVLLLMAASIALPLLAQ